MTPEQRKELNYLLSDLVNAVRADGSYGSAQNGIVNWVEKITGGSVVQTEVPSVVDGPRESVSFRAPRRASREQRNATDFSWALCDPLAAQARRPSSQEIIAAAQARAGRNGYILTEARVGMDGIHTVTSQCPRTGDRMTETINSGGTVVGQEQYTAPRRDDDRSYFIIDSWYNRPISTNE